MAPPIDRGGIVNGVRLELDPARRGPAVSGSANPARRAPAAGTAAVPILALGPDGPVERMDDVVGEEPLEIRLAATGRPPVAVGVTMRTPGDDFELAVGFLFSEGLLRRQGDVASVHYCDGASDPRARANIVTVETSTAHPVRARRRNLNVSASCGICGTATLEELSRRCRPLPDGPSISADLLMALPERLRVRQGLFDRTGGLHGAGLFDCADGGLLAVREDVGRHNAVDKLVGWAALAERLPLGSAALVVSGRVSFEIVQKAAVAGIPVLVAVSAPSSLAVQTARRLRMTLACFVRGTRANLYTDIGRVADLPCPEVASVPERPGATA